MNTTEGGGIYSREELCCEKLPQRARSRLTTRCMLQVQTCTRGRQPAPGRRARAAARPRHRTTPATPATATTPTRAIPSARTRAARAAKVGMPAVPQSPASRASISKSGPPHDRFNSSPRQTRRTGITTPDYSHTHTSWVCRLLSRFCLYLDISAAIQFFFFFNYFSE